MAYTAPTKLTKIGEAVKIVATLSGTGAKTPFQLLPNSGNYWGQVTFQLVPATVSVLVANLELDMTGVDANFLPYISGVNLFAPGTYVLNLSGGNVRYRWNVTSITGASGDIWAIAG